MANHLFKKCLKRIFTLFAILQLSYFANAQTDPLYYSKGEDLAKKTASYLFMKVETDKKEAFTGECIVAWYKLYVAVDIQGKLTKSPSFTGFASYDIEGADTDAYEIQKINGVPFRVYLVKQVQLFGLTPGTQRLEPVELEATIRFRKLPLEINDFLPTEGSTDSVFKYTLKSAPVEINIKKLPPDHTGKFSGAVGDFEFSSFAATNLTEAGKADTFQLGLKGSGNWHEVRLPAMIWPVGTEVFEPFSTENINTFAIPVEGLRTIAYPVVFNNKGNYKVAPVSFTFFNPLLRQYKTIKTDSILVTVTEAQKAGPAKSPGKQSDFTAIFSRYAVIIFPVAALALLGLLLYRKKS